MVKSDPLYQQLIPIVSGGSPYKLYPFPNFFTEKHKQGLSKGVCAALKAKLPTYDCGGESSAAAGN